MTPTTARRELLDLWRGMKEERDFYMPTWRDIVTFILPEAGRWLTGGGGRRGQPNMGSILNSAATESLDVSAAGMASSLTNPARQWFRMTTADPALAEVGPVREYLASVERLVSWLFARSNVHGVLVVMYRNVMAFGTAPIWVDSDDTDILRAHTWPVGQYALASSNQQRIDTVGLEFEFTVRQMMQEFGDANPAFSTQLKRLIERREFNQRVSVLKLVCPNEDLDLAALDGRQRPFTGSWLELVGDDDLPVLRQAGYSQFPAMVGRWTVNSTEDVYGIGPCHRVLPDVKQLQHTEDQKLKVLDKLVAPPLNHPGSATGDLPSIMAGALNITSPTATQKTEPTYVPDVRSYQLAVEQVRELVARIREGLNEDLWRLLSNRADEDPSGRMTAFEVARRHEEKLILLGPTVDRFHNEVLSPLIKRTVAILAEHRLLPPPPDELVEELARGGDVRIEYQSVLALAQRLLGLGSLERFAGIVSSLAPDPNDPLWDKVDRDEFLDQVGDSLGLPPNVVRSDDVVAEIRLSRARDMERQKQLQEGAVAAGTARDLAQAPLLSGGSALDQLLSNMGPVAEGVA